MIKKLLIVLLMNLLFPISSFATTVTVNPGGGGADYTSLNAALLAHEGVLSEPLVINCSGSTADTTPILSTSLDGYTLTESNYIEISGDNTTGKWNDNFYHLTLTNSGAIVVPATCNYIRIHNLQISMTYNGNDRGIDVNVTDTLSNIRIYNNIIKATSGSGNYNAGIRILRGDLCYIYNNIIYGFSIGANDYGIYLSTTTTGDTIYFENNTVVNCYVGYYAASNPTNIGINNISMDCTDGWIGIVDSGTTNNCSDIDSDAPATGRITGEVSFINKTSGSEDFHLSVDDTVAKDAGVNSINSGYTTDIDDNTRTGSWDLGADEYISSSVVGKIVLKRGVILK